MNVRRQKAAKTCIENGNRLLDDAEFLRYQEPPATAWFLAHIASEEFAKAFLLALCSRGILQWNQYLLRAARDHRCKHLLCLVMDHLAPDDAGWDSRMKSPPEHVPPIPATVVDAINILRHEKIGRWKGSWEWEEDPEYDATALSVSEGSKDRQKQDALYVRLAFDGGVGNIPTKRGSWDIDAELDRAKRYSRLVENVLEGEKYPGFDFDEIVETFRLLFESLA